jgi:hypothetical protein
MKNGDSTKRQIGRIWVRTIESQYRIRLTKEAAGVVHWMQAADGFSIECIARLGPSGQLLLLPEERQRAALDKLSASLEAAPARLEDVSAAWLDLIRYAATGWRVSCSFEAKGSRFSLVLPKEARDLGIVPSQNDVVVLFCTGEILEIWPGARWVQHVSKISSTLDNYASLVTELLESRGMSGDPADAAQA